MIDFNKKPYTEKDLREAFNRAKIAVFVGKTSSFLATIMSNLHFEWDDQNTKIASVCGTDLKINPDVFMGIEPKERQTIILHEIWHVARMHSMREEGKDHTLWNKACDIVINNMLFDQGYNIDKLNGLRDPNYEGMSEEEIYIYMDKNPYRDNPFEDLTPKPPTEDKKDFVEQCVSVVLKGQMASMQHNEISLDEIDDLFGLSHSDGSLTEILKKFFKRKVQWEVLLKRYLTKISDKNKQSWQKRNRRFPDIYLAGKKNIPNKLDHLVFFLDVSSSVTLSQIKRFNSEVKFIKEFFNPKYLTVVQFDTAILDEKTFTADQPYKNIKIVYGGGTSYTCVHEYLEKHKPTCGVIFTDLLCNPMDKTKIPTIWIGVDSSNHSTMPIQGQTILIESE